MSAPAGIEVALNFAVRCGRCGQMTRLNGRAMTTGYTAPSGQSEVRVLGYDREDRLYVHLFAESHYGPFNTVRVE